MTNANLWQRCARIAPGGFPSTRAFSRYPGLDVVIEWWDKTRRRLMSVRSPVALLGAFVLLALIAMKMKTHQTLMPQPTPSSETECGLDWSVFNLWPAGGSPGVDVALNEELRGPSPLPLSQVPDKKPELNKAEQEMITVEPAKHAIAPAPTPSQIPTPPPVEGIVQTSVWFSAMQMPALAAVPVEAASGITPNPTRKPELAYPGVNGAAGLSSISGTLPGSEAPDKVIDDVSTPDQPVGAQQSPPALARPLEPVDQPTPKLPDATTPFFQAPFDAPLGFTGPSGVLPREGQTDPHFVPMEDRWRIGFPEWKRYAEPTTPNADSPYQLGNWWDPFNQNVLKGDYPFLGQNTFFVLTAMSRTLVEPRQTPIGTTPFESTARPFEAEFFGRPNQALASQFFILGLEVFHGDAAFRPVDWRIKLTPVFNINYVDFDELAVVNPDVRRGTDRARSYLALQEWFVEKKIADLSPNYDFVSIRAGAQPFVSDFRGFIFSDTNRAVRLFGNLDSNREQFNVIYFRQLEKDTNSELNTFHERHQQILIGNFYVQDFVFPGYTAQWSITYNHDDPTFKFDNNSFLVRPDPVGTFTPHGLDVIYLGWTGDGHINRFNINHAAYWAFGRDSHNPIANQGQDISAGMAALELSYDRDYMRFRASALWASGDDNPRNGHATGFDAILDNPNFAGGEFSFWQRQAIRLFGVNLVNRESLFPNLRSSKIQGQSNFVNPGLFLFNAGVDADLTPKLRSINNINFLWFDSVEVLRTFTFQHRIDDFIGVDLSMGLEYRPLLNNNVIVTAGVASLIPGDGFRSLYNDSRNSVDFLVAGFVDLVLRY